MAKEYNLGILLVHGIGEQRSSETLVTWGDAMVKALTMIAKERDFSVSASGIPPNRDNSESNRTEVIVTLEDKDNSERWLLSEGYWADAFLPASYKEFATWSIEAIPMALTYHVALGYRVAIEGNKGGALKKAAIALKFAGILVFMLILAPFLVSVLFLTLLLGLLPIAKLRSTLISIQSKLLFIAGDSFAYVESPITAALIKSRVLNGVHSLKQRCDKTIVVAHSQGAAVALDALGGVQLKKSDTTAAKVETKPFEDASKVEMPDALVTFGAGINQICGLMVSASSKTAGGKVWEIWKACFYAILFITTPFLLFTFGVNIYEIIVAFGKIVTALLALFLLLILLEVCNINTKTKAIIVIILWVVPIFIFYNNYGFLLVCDGAIIGLLTAISVLFLFSKNKFSKNFLAENSIALKPKHLKNWTDIYASNDPIPNGKTRIAEGRSQPDSSHEIHNLKSVLLDHTTYWENLDGFVLKVVRICAKTTQSVFTNKMPDASKDKEVDERSEWRIKHLDCSYWIVAIIITLYTCGLWRKYRQFSIKFFNPPDWFPTDFEPIFHSIVVISFAIVLLIIPFIALKIIWQAWVNEERYLYLEKPEFEYSKMPNSKFFESFRVKAFIVIAIMIVLFAVLAAAIDTLTST